MTSLITFSVKNMQIMDSSLSALVYRIIVSNFNYLLSDLHISYFSLRKTFNPPPPNDLGNM